jgi:hypothetical protein
MTTMLKGDLKEHRELSVGRMENGQWRALWESQFVPFCFLENRG